MVETPECSFIMRVERENEVVRYAFVFLDRQRGRRCRHVADTGSIKSPLERDPVLMTELTGERVLHIPQDRILRPPRMGSLNQDRKKVRE